MQGHIHKRVRKDSKGKERTLWYVVVDIGVDATGRRRQKWHGSFRTRKDAEVARAKLVDNLHTGSYVVPGRTTLSEWITDSWLPMTAARVKPSTLHSYWRNLEIHVLPTLGGRSLQQITPTMLNALYAQLASDDGARRVLSAKTISYIHTIVHKALADAVDADLIGRNVAERAKPPRPSRRSSPRIQSWDADELRAFLAHVAGARLEAVWRLAAMTGMRRGEVLGLRWGDVDLDNARLSVRQALVAVGYDVVTSTRSPTTPGLSTWTPRPLPSCESTGRDRTPNELSGAATIKRRTWSSPRRMASRSTRTRSANRSSASSGTPACAQSACTISDTRTQASRSRPGSPSRSSQSVSGTSPRRSLSSSTPTCSLACRPRRLAP